MVRVRVTSKMGINTGIMSRKANVSTWKAGLFILLKVLSAG